jgi:hypothetical protein
MTKQTQSSPAGGVFVSAITFFAQQNVQRMRSSDFHVIPITEIRFFQIKCQLSHSSPKARNRAQPISWEKCHDDEQVLGRGRAVRSDVCGFKRVGGLELELPLVPNDGLVAGVRLYLDGAMPSVEAR